MPRTKGFSPECYNRMRLDNLLRSTLPGSLSQEQWGNMKSSQIIERIVTPLYRSSQLIMPGGYAPPPLFYVFLLTYHCNLSCNFCLQQIHRPIDTETMLDIDHFRQILSQIPWFSTIVFSGGEPFCHPDILQILESASQNFRVVLVTNGTLLDDHLCGTFVEMGSKRMGGKGISMIGLSMLESSETEPFHQVFEKKLELLHSLQEKKRDSGKKFPTISLKMTIRNDNIQYLPDLLSLLRNGLGDEITLQFYIDLPWDYFYESELEEDMFFNNFPNQNIELPMSIEDMPLLREQINLVYSSPEMKDGKIRFIPDTSPEEIFRYYSGQGLKHKYGCVYPSFAFNIDPTGRAFLCRNPKSELTTERSLREIWNSSNFRKFRQAMMKEDLAAKCAGCCFLVKL